MGAPTVIVEKLINGEETLKSARHLENLLQVQKQAIALRSSALKTLLCLLFLQYKSVAIGCFEIGGSNAMEPLVLAGDLGLPVVDADGMGRAFPELQMYVPAIEGHDVTPAVLTDEKVSEILTYTKSREVQSQLCLGLLSCRDEL